MSETFSRGNSWRPKVYDFICKREERHGLLEWRKALVGDLDGSVVELGAGTGLNFRHYPASARVSALDRDPVMLTRAIERARRAPATVEILVGDAQRLPFADDSAEVVVVGLMLCSVPDQQQALAEIRRVLRPGGKLRFVEHVRDRDGTFRARFQDAFNPLWVRVSGGCNCNRRTQETIEEAGLVLTRLDEFKLGHHHAAPHVMGEASNPG